MPYTMDFSGLQQAFRDVARNRLAEREMGMAQERLGFEREMHPLRLKAQRQATEHAGQMQPLQLEGERMELEAKKRAAIQSKLQMYDSFIDEQFGEKSTPEHRAAHYGKFISSPIFDDIRDLFDHPHMGPMLRDPELGPAALRNLGRKYRDPLEKRKLEGEIANVEGTPTSGTANIARMQNQLQIDLAKAKSAIEVEEILSKASALGLDVSAYRKPAAPPSAVAPRRAAAPGIGSDYALSAPAATPAAPPAVAPIRQGSVAPAPPDPYLQLTRPSISPEEELDQRKRRAAAAAVSGDIKGAGKILAKDEEPKEYQTKDASFAERMARSEISLLGVLGRDNKNYDPANYLRSWIPNWNMFNSAAWRDYQASSREWISAMLRKDTGAAVTETEWQIYFPTYFPQPGDDLNTQKAKMDRRIQAARSMRGSAGPAFDRMSPNFDVEMRGRLRDIDPATYGAKIDNGPLPAGAYEYDPSTGKVRPKQ